MNHKNFAEIAADASFFICFLDCTRNHSALDKILERFTFHVPPKVKEEILKSKNKKIIENHQKINYFLDEGINVGMALKPFFSEKQLRKGESEIIVTAYILSQTSTKEFYFILDEARIRKFVEDNCQDLKKYMIGTIGFVGLSYEKYGIFNKEECIKILNEIRDSKFHINKKVILDFISRIENGRS